MFTLSVYLSVYFVSQYSSNPPQFFIPQNFFEKFMKVQKKIINSQNLKDSPLAMSAAVLITTFVYTNNNTHALPPDVETWLSGLLTTKFCILHFYV